MPGWATHTLAPSNREWELKRLAIALCCACAFALLSEGVAITPDPKTMSGPHIVGIGARPLDPGPALMLVFVALGMRLAAPVCAPGA